MRSLINSAAATAICAMVAASLAPSQAAAGVVGIGEQAKIRSASPVEQIYYHHYYHRHYYHPHYVVGITITAAITVITRIITILRRRWSERRRPWRPSRSGVGDTLLLSRSPTMEGLHEGGAARECSRRFAIRLAR